MKIEMLSNSSVKVFLSNGELMRRNLSFSELGSKSEGARRLIAEIISAIGQTTAFPSPGAVLCAEAFKTRDGCVMYISAYPKPKRKYSNFKYLCCETASARDLIQLFDALKKSKIDAKESSVYCGNGLFSFVIGLKCKLSRKVVPLLSEYGKVRVIGNAERASIGERCECICERNAIAAILG